MAYINRGDTGKRHESRVIVCQPNAEQPVVEEIQIACATAEKEWGFDVIITLSRDEALELCAQLARNLRTPTPRERKCPSLGTQLWPRDTEE
jgi:hypothetical protein